MSTEIEVVTGTIEVKDAAVSQGGFGIPLLAVYHSYWAERVRTFSELEELTKAPLNVPTDSKLYRMARALKSQTPSPDVFKVGKRMNHDLQTVKITVASPAVVGAKYSFKLNDNVYTFVAATTDAADVAEELGGQLSSVSGLAAVWDDEVLTLTAAAKTSDFVFELLTSNLSILDASPSATAPNIATDLDGIRAADADWYVFAIDTHSKYDISQAASWAESQTQKVLFVATVGDTEMYTPFVEGDGGDPTDLASLLKSFNFHRTLLLYHHKPSQEGAIAWAGRVLPKPPGSINWANKSLANVEVSVLDDTARATLKDRNCNYYVAVRGIGFTLDGRAASGRFVDITHGMDWFDDGVRARVVGLLAGMDKIGFTDKHVELFRGQVLAQIDEGIRAEVIDGDEPYSVTVPRVASVNPSDRIARTLPNLGFSFVLQGAVNKVRYAGTVLVAI